VDDERLWRVGELAEATGLTVRALHHFDEIGLLRPAERSGGGHRLYTAADVRRLYRIVALRQLGLALAGIGRALDGPATALEGIVADQLAEAAQRLADWHRVHRRLAALQEAIRRSGQPSTEELIATMEAIVDSSHFTPDQLARLRERHERAGAAGFAEWRRRWVALVAELDEHRERGSAPDDPAVQDIARRWSELMDHLSDGDRSVRTGMYAKMDLQGAAVATKGVVGDATWDYVKLAFAVGF
jgi:DNA-binding transcriptional MerR regulator